MKPNYTPGPWQFDSIDWTVIPSANMALSICRIDPIDIGGPKEFQRLAETEANARLIAAAPALLEALIEISKWTKQYTSPGHPISTVADAAIDAAMQKDEK